MLSLVAHLSPARASSFTLCTSLSRAMIQLDPPPPSRRFLPPFPSAGRNTPEEQPHFNNFVVEVEQGYGSGMGADDINSYHNRRHATDVTQAVHYFLKVSPLAVWFRPPLWGVGARSASPFEQPRSLRSCFGAWRARLSLIVGGIPNTALAGAVHTRARGAESLDLKTYEANKPQWARASRDFVSS